MQGKNRLPVKLKDLQGDQEHIYKMAWIKCLSLLPSLSSLVRHIVSLPSITTLTNTSGAEPLSPHSDSQITPWTLVRRTRKLPFEEERVILQDERKQGKVISGRRNTQKYKTFFGSELQIPQLVYMTVENLQPCVTELQRIY